MAKKSKGKPVQKKKCPLKIFEVGIKQNDGGLKYLTIEACEVEYDDTYDSHLIFLGKDKEVVGVVREWYYWFEMLREDEEQEKSPILPENWGEVK